MSEHYTQYVFDLVHCDIYEPYTHEARDGFRYFLTIVDNHARCTWLYLMKIKS